jgi:hypothetical protein
MEMAKRPARMRRMLRAMDQLMALGARAESADGVVLMKGPPNEVVTRSGNGRRIS